MMITSKFQEALRAAAENHVSCSCSGGGGGGGSPACARRDPSPSRTARPHEFPPPSPSQRVRTYRPGTLNLMALLSAPSKVRVGGAAEWHLFAKSGPDRSARNRMMAPLCEIGCCAGTPSPESCTVHGIRKLHHPRLRGIFGHAPWEGARLATAPASCTRVSDARPTFPTLRWTCKPHRPRRTSAGALLPARGWRSR